MNKVKKIKKKKVGIFSLTCDEGCSIYLIEIFNKKLLDWLEKMEIHYFLSIKDETDIKDIDIGLVEGVVTTQEDMAKAKKIRKNCKTLIGMGNCAITGQPSCQRNFFDQKKLKAIDKNLKDFKFLPKCLSAKEAVGIDDEVPGCPMNREKFIEVFERYL